MYNRVELKDRSKDQIRGKVLILFFISILLSVVSAVLGMIPILGFIVSFLIVSVLSIGMYRICLDVTRGMDPKFERLLPEQEIWGKAICLQLLVMLFTFLWSLLLVIPGIIKAYSYAMAPYLLAEHPEMSASEAIKESQLMMDGHKMDLFILDLSFIGWALLVPITCGLILIYLIPYTMTARANFYRELTGGYQSQQPEVSYFSE